METQGSPAREHADAAATGPDPAVLRAGLVATTLRDERRLARRLDGAERTRGPRRAAQLSEVADQLVAAQARLASRAASLPAITYPDLPVSERRHDISDAIRDHQVVVVAGETGSGKTTQIPKICLELGRGVRGLVGHTQPRRIAARAVAERVAQELGGQVGGTVGYAVRFTDEVGPDSLVKLMTDGILLAEVQRDPDLLAYDTIIIDEAHERSLTIDFLLGYLHRLLPRRPDLKLVITSATIDPRRFADHFARPELGAAGEVPVVEVSGRTFPVEVRYRPLSLDEADGADGAGGPADAAEPGAREDGDDVEGDPDDVAPGRDQRAQDRDQTEGVLDAVAELAALGDGDVLVFLSGEREIRDTADALTSAIERGELPRLRPAGSGGAGATEVLPLFGRLSAAEQHRVFGATGAGSSRRVVLATNVAETSLTVPGIRYVVDTGTARISRYSARTKVQRLPIEPVSQASANQRSGRCGRVADGVAIRLYSERDFASRPEFTQPEVQRTSLASVILQMASLGLGAVEDFPFLDPPDKRQVRDGLALLHELGALEVGADGSAPTTGESPRLTDVGRRLAQVPADPRFARMLLQADVEGVVPEVLVLVAALSVQDVRERPLEQADAARESHRRFADEHSDFVSTLNLWAHLQEQAAQRSSSSFRRMCKAEFLHHLRIREWQDVHAQLRRVLRGLGVSTPSGPESAAVRTGEALEPVRAQVHAALLSGLLTQVGTKDERAEEKAGRGGRDGRDGKDGRRPQRRGPAEYLGTRGTRFAVAPGSVLAKRSPSWVVAAELVETSRLWARVVARVEPEQVEALAAHLVVRSHSEPRWSRQRGAAVATERVTLYGLPLVAARTVPFARIDPATSRELFIRHALVGGEWDARGASVSFVRANAAVAEQVEELQARTRRRDLRVDDEALVAFYDARLPADATSARAFEAWWKRERRSRPDLLVLTVADLVVDAGGGTGLDDAPTSWSSGSFDLSLSYLFEPGREEDGVTVHVPLAVLAQVPETGLDWGVPGWRTELVTALLRALPKPLRVQLVPVPDTAREVAAALPAAPPPGVRLVDAVAEVLRARRGVVVPPEAWEGARLTETAPHLLPTYALEDADGRVVARGKDLRELRERTAGAQRAAVVAAVTAGAPSLEREALTSWPPELALAEQVETAAPDGRPVVGFPSLLVERWDADPKGQRRIAVRVLATAPEAAAAHPRGVSRLARLALANPGKALLDGLGTPARLSLARSPHGSVEALLADCADAAVDHLAATRAPRGGLLAVRDAAAFDALLRAARPDVLATTQQVLGLVQRVLSSAREVERELDRSASLSLVASLADARAQLAGLVHPGFVAGTGLERLPDVQRYLRALLRRLEVLGQGAAAVTKDRDRAGVVQRLEADLAAAVAALPSARRTSPEVSAVRWMLQELRVSLFAQTVGASGPVSEKRVTAAIAALR